jgi:tetratricopeptide (TPR) repeat protein
MQRLVVALAFITIVACSTQVTEPVVTDSQTSRPQVNEVATIDNPCTTFDELSPPAFKDDVEDSYVIYRDYMRSKDYKQALKIWKKAYYNAPAANGRIRYQFDDGITLYKYFFNNAKKEEERKEFADSIFSVYDKRIECHPDDEYTVLGKKAFNCYYDLRDYADEDEVFEMFKKAFDGKGEDADYFIINPFSRMLYDRVLREEISVEEGSSYALKIMDLVKNNLSDCKGQSCEPWEIINDYAPDLLSGLEGIKGFYPCAYFVDRYFDQYLANPEDCENVSDVYLRLRFGDCPLDDPKMITLKTSKDKNCYVPPPPEGPLKLAYRALNDGEFKEAIALYDQYLSTSSDMERKAEIQLRVSKIYYVHMKDFVKARRYALDAAKTKSGWGAPYVLIGKLYASSGPLCGPGRGWDSQIVTWAAIDKFEYARKIDSSVRAEATKLINQYRQYMPSKEDIFQRRLNEGDAFRVPCWIQENTKIRAAS